MPELPELEDVKAAWLDQAEEEISLEREHLASSTRSEVIASIGAALFFAGVLAWRFAGERDPVVQWGCAAVIAWAAVTAFRFRSSIRRDTPPPDAFARTGREHYRSELLRRRDHLRSAWIWHGPLCLAGILATAAIARRIVPGRLRDALPVFVVLTVWAAIGVRRRFRQAAELQTELEGEEDHEIAG